MIKKIILTSTIILISTFIFSQNLTQTVRGTVMDLDNNLPIIGAEIIIANSNPLAGTTTDELGNFKLEKISIGRITLNISYLGYENQTIPNIVVNSGKEVVLQLKMQESLITMDEIVVTANKNKGEALNEMAILSARSISAEETNRYAGGFNDPSRIVSNFAGVTSTQDGSNDIIIRGNAPKYVQWRLEGVQITNPNHFADPNAVSGAVSTLNNNLLATSDFYTGAFSPEFGDVLSGVYDVKLRAGNNEKFESVFGFGLLGTDLTFEGPFKKGYGGSFLVNYRYSTASIASDLGLIDISGIPKFQDAAFKVVLPTKKAGVFSFFGLAGKSSFLFEDVTPATWETPSDNFMRADISEDFDKNAHLLNTGINHTLNLNQNSFIKTTIAFSKEGIEDNIFENKLIKIFDANDDFLRDSVVNRQVNYKNKLKKSTYRGAITYHNKLNAKNKIQVGTKYAFFDYQNQQSQLQDTSSTRISLVDFDENISTIRNFISWRHRVNENISIVSGFHNMNVLLNNKSTFEPRVAMNWKIDHTNSIHAGYGKHSNMESIPHYFSQIKQADGSVKKPNTDLDLLKAHHFVVGYERRFGKNLRAKLEAYYQYLYNLPVENNDTSYFATINEDLEFRFVDLVNEGTGKNYGIELTIERFFNNNYYYLINASLYESKYKSLEGIERNTQYNGNYLVNVLLGKEFVRLGKKKNQTLGLNAKVFFGGGRKVIPLLRNGNGQLAVDPSNNKFWDYKKAYEDKIEDTYQVIISASYKWNKPKTTHELFLNLDNVTNNKGKISEFYDENEPESIGYVTQFGFFPNLMYRVYF
ncbi:MAG: carboxypeptidase-like regulatory domain-containing protein [Saprospiraceae bacterium]